MKKDDIIYLQVKKGDKVNNFAVRIEDLHQLILNASIKKQQKVVLNLTTETESYEIPIAVKELKKTLKQAELMKNIVPDNISKYLVDVTQSFSKRKIKKTLQGRNNEIEKVWFYLSQKKRNNVFLIGEKEVGKTAIANEIIRQIVTNECPKEFYDTRVLMLRP